jgi:type I restriction-modification system DNA methylase subunit
MPDGGIPTDKKTLAAIHAAVSVLAAENLLIFTDAARTQSLWYWVKRENGKSHPRDHLYVKGQPGDLFISKLASLVVDISELDAQGNIALTEVATRLKKALDVEHVTKKFYNEFQRQHLAFLELIEGIPDDRQRHWYASVLLNRLMFIYFLQRKFFLDARDGRPGDEHYLQNKLAQTKKSGKDRFYSVFLKALFFEGFARPESQRTDEAKKLLGKIKYLNGGLFLPHAIEVENKNIRIPDVAFENVLDLFGRFDWNLNDTPAGKADEINPDVLGYIFEKYINQKEFGAYYTRPEITEYLCEQTIYKLVLDRINGSTLALTPEEREKSSQPHAKSGASSSSNAESDSPSPPAEGGEGRGEVGAVSLAHPMGEGSRVRVQFQSIADLLLNLDAPLCKKLLHEILPQLSLLDPACGSGAFLVAAMKTLINLYSAIIGKIKFLNDPDLSKWLAATEREHRSINYYIKKRIITDNLYGVDIMEEATEIARLRLFLALVSSAQNVEQLEPLPNIDFNILAGNSLIGLLRIDATKFDSNGGASVPASRLVGSLAPPQDRFTLQHSSDLGFTVETKSAPTIKEKQAALVAGRNAEKFAALLDHKNKSIDLYRRHAFKSQEIDALDQNTALIQLRSDIENVRREAYERMNRMLLDEFQALGIRFQQATWDDRKNAEGKPEKRALKPDDIATLHPFHWGYEFDRVLLQRGGFDAIITNPPWEIFKPNSKEFFEQHSELITKKKMTIHDFEKARAKLLRDPEIKAAWLEYLSNFPHVSAYYRSAPQFKNQISIVDGKKAGSDTNLYKLFTEQCFNLLRAGGYCGIVIPSGIYTDLGTKQLREMLFSKTEVTGLFCFENRKQIFENVDSRFKFVVLTFEKGRNTREFPAAFMRHEVSELERFPQEGAIPISVELVKRLSPDSLSVMEFKGALDVRIAEKMCKFPLLGEEISGKWNLVLGNEFHMTNDSHLFKVEPTKNRLPLFEGKMIWQFDHQHGEAKYWIDEKEGRKILVGTRNKDSGQTLDYENYRFAFREIASNTNERGLVSAILPKRVFANHKLMVSTSRAKIANSELLFCCGVANSFAFDFLVRQRTTTTISMFTFYQLPVPRLTAADAAFAPIVRRAARLICTTPEFDDLAKEVSVALSSSPSPLGGERAGVRGPSKSTESKIKNKDSQILPATDPAERARLRAELDGLIAHLYGLTEEEFAYILTTFPLVAQPVKDAALSAYRAVAKGTLK